MSQKQHLILWIFIVAIIVFRYITSLQNIPDGVTVRITDKVSNDPIRYDYSQRILIQGYKVFLPLFPEIYYGDEIVVEGIVAVK